jgi:hypothetical protein
VSLRPWAPTVIPTSGTQFNYLSSITREGLVRPNSSSLSTTHNVAARCGCSTYYFHPHPRQRLVGSALEVAKPAHSRMFWFCCPLIRSDPPSQAGASLVWGHENFAFEDDQGCQWRAWFNKCGRAFKIKAAWGHPEIVRKPGLKLG